MRNRREFIQSLSGATLLLLHLPMLKGCKRKSNPPDAMVTKVLKAMLCMQRATWEQGVAAQALLEYGESNLAYLMAKEAALRQAADGRLGVLYTDNGVTDPAASGEAVYHMAKLTNDDDLVQAHKSMLDYLLYKAPRTPEGVLHHTLNSPEVWVDSMYMAPPYLSVAGYHKEAIRQVEGIRGFLWNSESKLYSHRWHVSEKRFINQNFWGVGNGWVVAALARIIDTLPPSMEKERSRMVTYATETIDGCIKHLRSDGLFHNTINDTSSFVETNLSQMVAYSIYRGINSGWLSSNYLDYAHRMRGAAHAKVDQHGFVQDVCGAPWFNSPGRATEGQAFFILMEAAFRKIS